MAKLETNLSAAQLATAEALFAGTYSVTLGKREGTPTTIPVPVADMPANAILAMFGYGVQRKFNDAVGGSDQTLDDKVKAARDMIAAFVKGEVARARGTGESIDPIDAEIRVIIRPEYKKAWVATNDPKGWKALSEDDIVAGIDALFADQDDATQAAIRELATANVKTKADMAAAKAKLTAKFTVKTA